MKVGSLFSGIGGLEMGLERAGMTTVWQVEKDPYARAILAKNFPGVPCYDDITTLDPAGLVRPDLICGGFPCQPHSVAGLKRASADERDLWGAFFGLVRDLRPRWVLAENVPGLLTSEGGAFFGRVLRDLASIGFDAEWCVRGARDVGAPHRRDRVFLLAYPHGLELRQQPKPELGSESPTFAPVDGTHGPLADTSSPGREARAGVGLRAPARSQSGPVPRQDRPPWGAWAAEPDVGRVADGVPSRVDRLRALGNAVVPQVAEEIGRLIMRAEIQTAPGPGEDRSP